MSVNNANEKEVSAKGSPKPSTPENISAIVDTNSSVTEVNSADSPIELASQEYDNSGPLQKDSNTTIKSSKKNKGQMTFDDFKSVKVVPSNEDDGSLRRSHRIKVSVLKKKEDDVIKEQKRIYDLERESELTKLQPKLKKPKTKKQPKIKVKVKMKLNKEDETKKASAETEKDGNSEASSTTSKPLRAIKPKKLTKEDKPKVYKPRSQISMDLLHLKATLTRINEKDLYTKNWCSATPIRNQSHNLEENKDIKLNEVWKEEFSHFLKPLPYAGKIIKTMSFINKFKMFLDSNELQTLSFQDFENGLNLNESTKEISQIKHCQDKMNYLFYSLLRLLFDNNIKAANFNHFMSLGHPFSRYITMLRRNCFEWGIVKEWRDIESGGFFTTGLDKIGLLILKPMDKVIILDSLVTYLLAQCPSVHDMIQTINYDKKDLGIKDESFYASRYLLEGPEKTLENYGSLCDQVIFHLDRKRVNMIKKKRAMKDDFKEQCKVLRECKDILKNISPDEDKNKIMISLYDKWLVLFEGLILDNPLSDPYDNDLYTLRLLDFFIGTVPEVGEFYLPQLHVLQPSSDFNIFKDVVSLLRLFEKFETNQIDTMSLFEEFHNTVSNQFKMLYYDKTNILYELLGNTELKVNSNNNWFEICNDTKSLQLFIDALNKIISDSTADSTLTNLIHTPEKANTKQHFIILKDYLTKIIKILKEIEKSIELSKTITPVRGRLRDSSRREIKPIAKETSSLYDDEELEDAGMEPVEEPADEDYDIQEDALSEYEEEEEDKTTKAEQKVKDDLNSNIPVLDEQVTLNNGRSRRSRRSYK